MGEAANQALTSALLEATHDLKANTKALDRVVLQLSRISNASEDTNTLALNEVRESKLASEKAVAAAKEVSASLIEIKTALGLMREATGAQKTHKREHAAVGILKAFGQLPPSARWALVAMAPALAFLGWCVHELFTK